MSYGSIAFELSEDGVALITIKRPERLNALDRATVGELDDVFSRAASDASVRGILLTGAGDKAFVAGADIRELAALDATGCREFSLRGQRAFRKLETLGRPSVAAINGYALGGGLELAMCCTFRVAVPDAKLGQPEVKLGIIPGYGGTQRLPRLVGRGRALEMLLTGESIDAEEALKIGLVDHIVPRYRLLEFGRELLRKILANAPAAVSLTMETVDAGLSVGFEEGLRAEAAAFGLAAATEDRAEGMRAFLEKRPPVFRGK